VLLRAADHRSAELARAVDQLCMARVISKVFNCSANGIPLGAEKDDVGRCGALQVTLTAPLSVSGIATPAGVAV